VLGNFSAGDTGWYKSDPITNVDAAADPLSISVVADGGPGGAGALVVTTNGTPVASYSNVGISLTGLTTADGGALNPSAYNGITFWATGTTSIDVAVQNPAYIEYQGPTIQLTSTWTQYQVPWSAFVLGSWEPADAGALSPATIAIVQFEVGGGLASNYQLADVGFY